MNTKQHMNKSNGSVSDGFYDHTQYMRIYRKNMSDEKKIIIREKDKIRKRLYRSNLTDTKREELRLRDRLNKLAKKERDSKIA